MLPLPILPHLLLLWIKDNSLVQATLITKYSLAKNTRDFNREDERLQLQHITNSPQKRENPPKIGGLSTIIDVELPLGGWFTFP